MDNLRGSIHQRLDEYRSAKLSRREVIRHLTRLGLSAPTIATLLGTSNRSGVSASGANTPRIDQRLFQWDTLEDIAATVVGFPGAVGTGIVTTTVAIGGEIVEVVIDFDNLIVKIEEETFRSITDTFVDPTLAPLAELGILKSDITDDLILLTPKGIIPKISWFTDGLVGIGSLIGVMRYRTMRGDERRIARYVFGDSLPDYDQIRLTNLGGFGGRPFAVPSQGGGAMLHMGPHYRHKSHIQDMPVLIHELTHAWQIKRSLLEVQFICNGILVQLENEKGDSVYDYSPGAQWSTYGLEQQAAIVEDWVKRGSPSSPGSPLSLSSSRFRYVNGNVRPGRNGAHTASGGSIRARLAEAGVETGSLRQINPPRPKIWW